MGIARGESIKKVLMKVIKTYHDNGLVPYLWQIVCKTQFSYQTVRRHLLELEKEGIVELIEDSRCTYVKLKDYNGNVKFPVVLNGRSPKFLKGVKKKIRRVVDPEACILCDLCICACNDVVFVDIDVV